MTGTLASGGRSITVVDSQSGAAGMRLLSNGEIVPF
jgi:hypothetical protein